MHARPVRVLNFAHKSRGLLPSAPGAVRRGPRVIPSEARRTASEVEGSRWSAGGAHRPAATGAAHEARRRCRGSVCSLPNEIPRLRSAKRHSARDDNRCPRICGQGSALSTGRTRGGFSREQHCMQRLRGRLGPREHASARSPSFPCSGVGTHCPGRSASRCGRAAPPVRGEGRRSSMLLHTRSTVSMHGVRTQVFGAPRGDRPSGDDVSVGAPSPGHGGLRVQVCTPYQRVPRSGVPRARTAGAGS